jgi:uncharacterized protein with von Willebrand factor type A (vWA) domain
MGKTGKPLLDRQNLKHDLFDFSQYAKMKKQSAVLKDSFKGSGGNYTLYPELLEDSFYAMFKYAPELQPPENVELDAQLNRGLLALAMESNEYEQLRASTRLDPVTSATAAAAFATSIVDENPDVIDAINKYLVQMKDTNVQIKDLQKEIKKQQQAQKKQPMPQTQQQIQMLQQSLKGLQQQQQQACQGAQQQIQQVVILPAVQTALDAIEFENEALSGWGTGAGTLAPVSFEDRLALQKAFLQNKKIRQIMQMAGRMRRLAFRKQKEKSKHAMEEITDIVQSDDIAHLLISEAALLVEPELEVIFDLKYTEKQLLTYEITGNETKGKGPIVVCLDVSGSMGGDRDCWAKGVALALVEIAHKEKRNAIVIVFDHSIQHIFEFMKGHFSFKTMLELASYFTGGGTAFDPPLEKAMEYLKTDAEFKKGDVIFITDGESDVSEHVKMDYLDLKVQLRFTHFTIVIGAEFGMVQHSLKPISDRLIAVDSLTNELAADVFESV